MKEQRRGTAKEQGQEKKTQEKESIGKQEGRTAKKLKKTDKREERKRRSKNEKQKHEEKDRNTTRIERDGAV